VRFAQGFGGEIRLSRDWPLANEYLIKGTKGSVRWEVNEADKVEIRVNDNPYTLRAQLYDHDEKLSRLRRPAANFHRSFIEQLLDVATAIRFHKRPHVSGEDGLHSVKLIEHCYRYRNLMPMPWFREADYNRARQLSVIR
jgi:predicted dehydrogenase